MPPKFISLKLSNGSTMFINVNQISALQAGGGSITHLNVSGFNEVILVHEQIEDVQKKINLAIAG